MSLGGFSADVARGVEQPMDMIDINNSNNSPYQTFLGLFCVIFIFMFIRMAYVFYEDMTDNSTIKAKLKKKLKSIGSKGHNGRHHGDEEEKCNDHDHHNCGGGHHHHHDQSEEDEDEQISGSIPFSYKKGFKPEMPDRK